MLEIVHAILQLRFDVNGFVNKVERLNTALVNLHKAIAPCVETIVDSIIYLLCCLRTVVVRVVNNLNIPDIDNRVKVTFNHKVTIF